MTSTPSNAVTEVLTVDLASIHQDPSWPVDPVLVMSFRASITRGEPPLLDLSLNRVRHADGTLGLEVIDGMHRLAALRLEGVASHGAKVREYSPQDAFYARIATSIGKPNDLVRQRAERALRDGFVRDVAAHLEGATLYERTVDEEGTPRPAPRREPLPSDPLLALGTILWIHFAAKPEVSEDWERFVVGWLEDIAGRLGKTPAWLRDEVLDITALLGEDLPGKPTAERARFLLAIPDDGILRLVLARLKAEPRLSTTDLRFALDMLGCGPDVGRHSWLPPRGLPQMRSMLAHATLSQLARDYMQALVRAEAAARVVKPPPAPAAPTPAPTAAPPSPPSPPTPPTTGSPTTPTVAPVDTGPRPHLPAAVTGGAGAGGGDTPVRDGVGASGERAATSTSSQVFGTVSPQFAGMPTRPPTSMTPMTAASPPALQGAPPTRTPSASTSAGPPTEDAYPHAQSLTNLLIRAWQAFDERQGDWSRPEVRRDLTRLRTLIDGYLARGTCPTGATGATGTPPSSPSSEPSGDPSQTAPTRKGTM